jgi:hypothetical protein
MSTPTVLPWRVVQSGTANPCGFVHRIHPVSPRIPIFWFVAEADSRAVKPIQVFAQFMAIDPQSLEPGNELIIFYKINYQIVTVI